MVENNDVQDKIVIRPALIKDAETVFKMIRSLAKYHGEGAEFRATIEDVERNGFGELQKIGLSHLWNKKIKSVLDWSEINNKYYQIARNIRADRHLY